MRRFSTALVMGMLALLVFVVPVGAGVSWCRADPIVSLNGTEVQVWVAVPDQYVGLVNGPIDVQFVIPAAVERYVVFTDAGFNGYGETVSFANKGKVQSSGAFSTNITVKVPIQAGSVLPVHVPVQVEVIVNGQSTWYTGTANGTWISTTVQGAT